MSTNELFRADSYLKVCDAEVSQTTANAVVVDRTVFYPLGGGQPGDTGTLGWGGHTVRIINTVYGDNGDIEHVVDDGVALPGPGTPVTLAIDWDRRFRHMRMHTALHLLGAVLRFPVTGGNISTAKSRLDFNMEAAVNKESLSQSINELVQGDFRVSHRWISDAELDENPDLVRTMSVQPPRGKGAVRLLDIDGVDLQPCGGTHVRSTAEVGAVRIGKVEKKGRQNRRVNIYLDD